MSEVVQSLQIVTLFHPGTGQPLLNELQQSGLPILKTSSAIDGVKAATTSGTALFIDQEHWQHLTSDLLEQLQHTMKKRALRIAVAASDPAAVTARELGEVVVAVALPPAELIEAMSQPLAIMQRSAVRAAVNLPASFYGDAHLEGFVHSLSEGGALFVGNSLPKINTAGTLAVHGAQGELFQAEVTVVNERALERGVGLRFEPEQNEAMVAVKQVVAHALGSVGEAGQRQVVHLDASELFCKVTESILSSAGYSVSHTTQIPTALGWLAEAGQFDLFMLDSSMRVLGGERLKEVIRRAGQVPTLLYSPESEVVLQKTQQNVGASAFLKKRGVS